MEANKILSAPLIDLLFDGRNKDYGAYELRKTNSKRTKIALSVTVSVVALIFSAVSLANASKPKGPRYEFKDGIELTKIDEPLPEEIPEPEPEQPEQEPVETVAYTAPEIVPDEDMDKPLADMASVDSAKVGTEYVDGIPDDGFERPEKLPGDDLGVIPPKPAEPEDGILTSVEIPAKFKDNWSRFLLKHLDPETPIKNDAPHGRYSVVVQFVVDKEGNVSDIKPLTNHGHGMEEEAVRVLKKSPQWEAAFQNGHKVKAYHRQIITFEVNPEE